MTKELLLKTQTEYYDNVNKWFVGEMAKWSKKHNMHLQDYTILRMWVIGSDDAQEPWSHHRDTDLDETYKEAIKDYEQLVDDLKELGINCWQGLEYSDRGKFLH